VFDSLNTDVIKETFNEEALTTAFLGYPRACLVTW
jgi:hypothetical protein